jgi:pimeloyl-ACP methyl ester carboxylesterase
VHKTSQTNGLRRPQQAGHACAAAAGLADKLISMEELWSGAAAPGRIAPISDLFYDYRTNVASYPAWQAWLRRQHPATLVIWGEYDPSFQVAEAEAYRRDVPDAEIHILEAGHFALDEKPGEIAALTQDFLDRALRK